MEDLIPDSLIRKEVLLRLYNNDSLLSKGGIFTDKLQSMINAALEGEIDYSLKSEVDNCPSYRHNNHISKQVRSSAGTLYICHNLTGLAFTK